MINKIISTSLIVSILLTFSCSYKAEKIDLPVKIDTTDKPILLQEKKVFGVEELKIYASNEFDGARLNDFIKLNDSTIQVVVSPENVPCNTSAYYAFKIWSSEAKSILLEFKYPEGYQHRYYPKVYKSNKWKNIDSSLVFQRDSTTVLKLDISQDTLLVAGGEIHSSTDVQKWYSEKICDGHSNTHEESYGLSKLGRNLPMIDIYNGVKKEKPIVVIMTRQHPPELTGYYGFQSFMETLMNDSKLNKAFFDKYRVLCFPILNPDGVDLGHWRHNAGGVDLNRDWANYNQPEVRQAVDIITKITEKDKAKLILALDFHSTYHDVFYTNIDRKNTTLPTFIDDWFALMNKNIDNYEAYESSSVPKKPVSKTWFYKAFNATAITFEFGDNTPKERIKTISEESAVAMMNLLLKEE